MSNEVTTTGNKTPQSVIKDVNIQKMIAERLGARAGQFTTSLLSLVNSNSKIAECAPMTIIQAALTAAAMDLPINQNLGFAYIVPYKNKGVMEAQFQMGWKGFVQLAQRSGKFKTINTTDVREGEVKSRDRMTGDVSFSWIDDDAARNKTPIVGYLAYIELTDGFRKTLYMTKAEIESHAGRYSQAYKSRGKSSFKSPWETDFDLMAQKTALKLLLNKYAPLSTELQTAVENDQAVIREDGKPDFIDGETVNPALELPQEAIDEIEKAANAAEIEAILEELTVDQRKQAVTYVNARMTELHSKKK